MTAPQFGEPQPGLVYPDRLAAFGVARRGGKMALVSVKKPKLAAWLDLPGGALDPGETESQALVREFGEETGLQVRIGALVARADQFFIRTDGAPANNRGAMFEVVIEREDPVLKIEADHTVVWLDPNEAVRRLRHDAHAWAVVAWLRRSR